MSIWKLKPINTSQKLWSESIFMGVVYIEAKSEIQARHFAYDRYCAPAHKDNSSQHNPSAWLQEDVVICQKVDDENDASSGNILVLIEIPYHFYG